ncbi:hotdog domain-containing protein [Nocardia sp. NPDC059239]|uniref:hotdog domain-containing protein n=1 Tax=unclassified Nocardia TaxID=2637762 RepID=UPI00368AB22A
MAATRRLQDALTGADAPIEILRAAARSVEDAATALEEYQVDWRDHVTGMQMHLPGRGQTLSPPAYVDRLDKHRLTARWTFTRFYRGGGGVVHGGTIPLIVDEMCGRLASHVHDGRSRTAYLKVDYRKVTPLDRELRFETWVERHEGRKLFVAGALRDGDDLLCEVSGLFIALLPGQI